MELKWGCPEFKDKIIIRLGGHHVSMNFRGGIGKHVEAPGLQYMWIQSNAIDPLKADKILNGKSYKSGMQFHKLTS